MKTKTLRYDGGPKQRLEEAGQVIAPGQTFEVSEARAKQLLANPYVPCSVVKPPSPPKPSTPSWAKPKPAITGGETKEGDEK